MSTKTKRKPKTRKEIGIPKNYVLGMYGKIVFKPHCKWYCTLHKCYLQKNDVTEKKCFIKKCNYLRRIDNRRY